MNQSNRRVFSHSLGLCLLSLTLCGTAFADKLAVSVSASTGVHAVENADLRELDESTDRSVIDSDDRRLFGHSDITAKVRYQVEPEVDLRVTSRFEAIWREDMLGRSAGSTGDLNFYELNVGYDALKSDALSLSFRMGRQPFSIGGVPSDYILAGTLDAVTAKASFGRFGQVRLLGIDFFGGNSLPETGYRFYRNGRQTTYNLRGETNTLRSGLIYEYLGPALKTMPVELRAYYFYATIGGGPIEESGADITYGGALGNYRDSDFQHLMGTRATYVADYGKTDVRVFGEFAMSNGIDRKPTTDRNVDTSGMAYGGGAVVNSRLSKSLKLSFAADFYHFDGATYASDGLEFERGFVGFMGDRIGGATVGRYLAWRPASHVNASGVTYAPHDQSRVAGTEFIHAKLGAKFRQVSVELDYWNFLKDTGSSFLDIANLNSGPEPPFGHTRAEFAAQERFGLSLGEAFDTQVTVHLTKRLDVVLGGGVFLPGDYYAIEVDRVAGDQVTALGGEALFWAANAGVRLGFK